MVEEEGVDVVVEAEAEEEGDEVVAVVEEVAEEDAATTVITAGVEATATKAANQRAEKLYEEFKITVRTMETSHSPLFSQRLFRLEPLVSYGFIIIILRHKK